MYEILPGLAVAGSLTMFLWGGGCSRNKELALVDRPDPDKAAATSSDIKTDEVVVFYPTAAHYDASNSQWIVPIHGVIYEPEQDSSKRAVVVASIRRAAGVETETLAAQRLDERVRLFLVDNERGKTISIRLGTDLYEVGTSGPDGHFQADLRIPATRMEDLPSDQKSLDGFATFAAVTRAGDARSFAGRVQLVPPQGVSIISDIDDTIKHTQVRDRKAVLTNTFLQEFQPVTGMAELYRQWAQQGCVFHYVSGSPWQLYLPLDEFFRTQGLPAGSVHLKMFRLKDPSALDLLQSQMATKLRAIEPLLEAFPERRFVLIGDSGEQDPEIYTEVARTHRPQVVGVFIRNVTGEQLDGERCRALRPGLEGVRFHLFDQADELRPLMEEITRVLERPDDRCAAQVIEVRVDGQHPASHTALVDAAVGDAVWEQIVGVDPAVAGHHGLGHAGRAHQVGRPDAVGQSVVGGVGHLDRLGFVPECGDISDRPEDLLACRDIVERSGEQCGFEIESAAFGDLRGPAGQEQLSTFILTLAQVAQHASSLFLADDRTHLSILVQLITDGDALEPCHARLHEAIVNRLLHEPARGIATDLTGVERDGLCEFLHGVVQIDVVEHDGGTFASQFELDGHKVSTARFCDQATDLWRAREGHAAQEGVRRQSRTGCLTEPGHHVNDPVGNAHLLGQPSQIDGG
jgi:hypothetical protein